MSAIEESLRFGPQVQLTARVVKEDFEFRGANFKSGQLLILSLAAANHDPQINDRPNEFDITREKSTLLSFGHGIHLCLGMSLARLEAKIVFEKLFEKFPELKNAQANLDWGQNPMFRGLEQLYVRSSVAAVPDEANPSIRDAAEEAAEKLVSHCSSDAPGASGLAPRNQEEALKRYKNSFSI